MSNIPDCVIVDDDDREFLESMGKWHIGNRGYCVRRSARDPVTKKQKTVLMHRVVLERKLGRPIAPGMVCDHIQPGNKLDNSRSNLREITQQQNQFNTRAKGYYWHKDSGKWMAYIRLNRKLTNLGYYATEAEARAAYLAAKEKYHKIP